MSKKGLFFVTAGAVLAAGVLSFSEVARPASGSTIAAGRAKLAPNLVRGRSVTGNVLYGGGSSAPGIAFGGLQAFHSNPVRVPALPGEPSTVGSVFGVFLSPGGFPGDAVSYCQTGDGYGEQVLEGVFAASGKCANLFAPPLGFGAPAGAGADFIASDSPVTVTDYQQFEATAAARVEYVQVPYIAGAIAILYNDPDFRGTLTLAPAEICKIADGEITNWDQVSRNPKNLNGTKPNDFYPARPLKWIYRTDGSGTTFALSNYLSSPGTCGETYGLNEVYDPFNTTVVPNPGTGVLPSPLPRGASHAGFLGAHGDRGLIACIQGLPTCRAVSGKAGALGGPGSIGYVEAANAKESLKFGAGFDMANIYTGGRFYSPIHDLPEAASTIATAVTDNVMNTYVENGRPSPETLTVNSPAHAGCLALVDPITYAQPASGYPIVSVTNLDFGYAGNGTKVPDLVSLAELTSNPNNFGRRAIKTVDVESPALHTGRTGYSSIALSETAVQTLASNCIKP